MAVAYIYLHTNLMDLYLDQTWPAHEHLALKRRPDLQERMMPLLHDVMTICDVKRTVLGLYCNALTSRQGEPKSLVHFQPFIEREYLVIMREYLGLFISRCEPRWNVCFDSLEKSVHTHKKKALQSFDCPRSTTLSELHRSRLVVTTCMFHWVSCSIHQIIFCPLFRVTAGNGLRFQLHISINVAPPPKLPPTVKMFEMLLEIVSTFILLI